MVSISGCDPLDPGSNPGTAITFFCRLVTWKHLPAEMREKDVNTDMSRWDGMKLGLIMVVRACPSMPNVPHASYVHCPRSHPAGRWD